MTNQPLLATITGEHFQPVRLHYKVLKRPGLVRAFKTLRCLDYDSARKRWVWLYGHEAKNLRFEKSYAQLPKDLHPIVIGAFFLRTEETLLLHLRSCDRALLAIPFFDTHLPRRLVELEYAEIVNRLFPATETNVKLTPDALFDSRIDTGFDSDALLQRLAEKAADVKGPEEKLRMVLEISNPGRESRCRRSNGYPSTTLRTALTVSSWHYGSGNWSPWSTGGATANTLWAMRSGQDTDPRALALPACGRERRIPWQNSDSHRRNRELAGSADPSRCRRLEERVGHVHVEFDVKMVDLIG